MFIYLECFNVKDCLLTVLFGDRNSESCYCHPYMKYLFCLLSVLFFRTTLANLTDIEPCLTKHIHEAMVLNKQRKPLYSELSQGLSERISDKMIAMEYQLIALSPFADAWAVPFQAAGISIVCEDLVPMEQTPDFTTENPEGMDSVINFHPPDIKYIQENLLIFFESKEYLKMAEVADQNVKNLDHNPRYNCMVKHILESIRRMAALTPKHAEKSKKILPVSTELLSRVLLKNHIKLLATAAKLDQLAAPLQAAALPIICQDVPYIPMP